MYTAALCLVALATYAVSVSSLALPSKPSAYPFNQLVAFGDDLSDNGNGSYAHNISGGGADNYGFGTWTDGPIAVSYLADLLEVPLVDYAFGGSDGGANFGATINNTYTASKAEYNGKPVPSVHDQIFWNYTRDGAPNNIKNAMQFIWTGQNDLNEQTDVFWEGDPINELFISNISDRIRYNAERLIERGAPYVLVSNVYPKHKAPVATTYFCPDGTCLEAFGNIIKSSNTAIENEFKSSNFMMDLMENKDSHGLTQPLSDYCDGDPKYAKWDECAAGSYVWEGATKFFWMTFTQPTTTVHQMIAMDMKRTIDDFLGH
ncbi:hypothetical protein LTR10_007070 [Elasticomyces elasticus]|nr:hypothetical protein LTR10_007070 [Elasticomyces elasticus]KAK4978888.1 hypothetical protein LTR42_001388 [Elasticomyces elasticus]